MKRDPTSPCNTGFALPEVQAAFSSVRDIPYAAQYQLFRDDNRLQTRVGEGCTQKAVRLGNLLSALGLATHMRRISFRWAAVLAGLHDVPDRLLSAASQLGPRWHLYLSVRLPDREVVVDPTWDAALRHAGLPVNLELEPNANMALAVPIDGVQDPLDASTLVQSDSSCLPVASHRPGEGKALALHKHYYVFVLHFNRWLVRQRAVGK